MFPEYTNKQIVEDNKFSLRPEPIVENKLLSPPQPHSQLGNDFNPFRSDQTLLADRVEGPPNLQSRIADIKPEDVAG